MSRQLEKVKLGDVLDIRRGMSCLSEFYAASGRYIRLTLGNFKYPDCGWKENTSKGDLYFTGQVKDEFVLKKGDIITPLTEQVRGLLGNTATIPEDDLYIQSSDIALIIPKFNKIYDRFAYYLVSSPTVKKQLDSSSQQTKIRHTSPDKIKDCIAFIPDMEKQKQISKLLDAIDSKISLNTKINKLLEGQLKTLYDYWFTQFDFPDESGKPYRQSGGKMVYNEKIKREIPEGWEVKELGEILRKNTKTFGYDSLEKTIDLSVMPSDSMSIQNYNMSDSFKTNLFILNKGDILFGSIRPYLRKAGFAPFDGTVSGTVHSYQVKKDVDYNFALVTMCRNAFFDFAVKSSVGTKMPVIKNERLLEYLVPYDKEIVAKYNQFDFVKKMMNNICENHSLTQLRDFLLPLLLNGQARVE